MTRDRDIDRTFDRIAPRYDRYAALESEVCARLLERVAFRRQEPSLVLDLGCGTGQGAAALKKQFRKARVLGVDRSPGMLERAGKRSRFARPLDRVRADIHSLPFARQSADLVFSNLALPWLSDRGLFFEEVRRVLKPGGMFLFSTIGPASLEQLAGASVSVLGSDPRPAFPDLLQLGDALVAAGFREPVMDIDWVTLSYRSPEAMFDELEATGSATLFEAWSRIRGCLPAIADAWERNGENEPFPLGFEIIYGAAFGPSEGQPRRTAEGEVATFSVDSLVKSRKLGYD